MNGALSTSNKRSISVYNNRSSASNAGTIYNKPPPKMFAVRKISLDKGIRRSKIATSKSSFSAIDGNILHSNDIISKRLQQKVDANNEYKLTAANRRNLADRIYAFFYLMHKITRKAVAKQTRRNLKAA